MLRLSIIVPVFNGAAYIERCIQSLCNQSLLPDEYEIIVVDDGSKDDTPEILLQLSNRYQQLKVHRLENGGVSKARNFAIAVAAGRFIMPVDADDEIPAHVLPDFLSHAEKNNLQVLTGGFEIRNTAGVVEWKTQYAEISDKLLNGTDGYFTGRGYEVRFPDRSWGILFDLLFLRTHSLIYPLNVPYLEDGMFVAKVYSCAHRCGYYASVVYTHCLRIGSATRSPLLGSEVALTGFLNGLNDLKEFRDTAKKKAAEPAVLNHAIAKFALLPLMVSIGGNRFDRFKKVVHYLQTHKFRKLNLEGARFDGLKYGSMYNRSPWYFGFRFLMNLYLVSIKHKLGMGSAK